MRRLRLAGAAVLELDPLDLLLIASVARYALEVRALIDVRRGNRARLAGNHPKGAGVDVPRGDAGAVDHADGAGPNVGAGEGGSGGLAGAGPDYAGEAAALEDLTPAAAGALVDLVDVDRELRGQ